MGVLVDQSKVPADPTESRGILSQIEDGAKGLGDAFGGGFGGLIGGIFGGFLNIFRGRPAGEKWIPNEVEATAIEIRDGQTELSERADLLEGVRGYAAAYQTKNVYSGYKQSVPGWLPWWNTTVTKSEERILPFSGKIGPSKGATVHEDGIRFDEVGLWTVFVMCRRRGTGSSSALANPTRSNVYINVVDESGEVYSPKDISVSANRANISSGDQSIGTTTLGDHTVTAAIPVVIPDAGMTVVVSVKDSGPQWWLGGTKYSMLAVVKQDSRSENPGQETVPDEEAN